MGDAILSLPLIAELARHGRPIDVLVIPAVAAVYTCCANVRTVITVPFVRGKLQWSLRYRTAKSIRGRYTTAIILPNSLKSVLIPWLARIPVRRARPGEGPRRLLLTECRPLPSEVPQRKTNRPSMLEQYLGLADSGIVGASINRMSKHRPRMTLPVNLNLEYANVSKVAPKVMQSSNLLAICPGAEYGPAKQWPPEYFAKVANEWCARSEDHAVVILGGSNDVKISDEIIEQVQCINRVANLVNQTSLIEAFACIARARAVVSNDSGLMHAAAALGVPVVGIYGSSDPQHTPPHYHRARTLWLQLSCSPCFQRCCPLGTTACLRDLDPSRVITALNALIVPSEASPAWSLIGHRFSIRS